MCAYSRFTKQTSRVYLPVVAVNISQPIKSANSIHVGLLRGKPSLRREEYLEAEIRMLGEFWIQRNH